MGQKVLVADDEPRVRDMITVLLDRAGYQVRTTSSAAGIHREVWADMPDLLITDIHMDDTDDLSFLDELPPELPVIVMTGEPSYQSALTALRHRVVEYLEKPFTGSTLRRALIRGLRRAGHAPPAPATPVDPLPGLTPSRREVLTPRELELLTHFARGLHAEDLADAMDLSLHTVRNHLKAIRGKLGVRSQHELLAMVLNPPGMAPGIGIDPGFDPGFDTAIDPE